MPKESLWSYYQYASDYRKSGAVLQGGCLVKILCPFIGVVGAYVVLVVLMVICVILITERSLLAPLWKKEAKKAYADMKRRQGRSICPACEEQRRKKRKTGRRKQKTETEMILPEESDHKSIGCFFCNNAAGPGKVKCQRRQQRKSVKEFFRKRSGYAGTDCSQESDFQSHCRLHLKIL